MTSRMGSSTVWLGFQVKRNKAYWERKGQTARFFNDEKLRVPIDEVTTNV